MRFTIWPAATAGNIDAVVVALDAVPYTDEVEMTKVGGRYRIDFDAASADVLSAVRREVEAVTGPAK